MNNVTASVERKSEMGNKWLAVGFLLLLGVIITSFVTDSNIIRLGSAGLAVFGALLLIGYLTARSLSERNSPHQPPR